MNFLRKIVGPNPDIVVPRLLLAHTLKRMQKIRPEVVAEYRENIALLHQEHSLSARAHGVLQRLVTEVYP